MESKIAELNTQTNANEKQPNKEISSKKLFTQEQVEDSPIWIVGKEEEKEYFAILGENRITEIYETAEEVRELIEKRSWNLIITIASIVAEKIDQIKTFNKMELEKQIKYMEQNKEKENADLSKLKQFVEELEKTDKGYVENNI